MSAHALTRAKERLGAAHWTATTLRQISDLIVAGKSLLLARRPGGAERHALRFDDYDVIVVWNPKNRAVMTVLPRDALNFIRTIRRKHFHPAGRH